MDDDLPKVIWMSGPREESFVTDLGLVFVVCLEEILLNIADTLHDETNGE